MFIANFDFLNSPPQLYFLQKRTNKTIIGGILFILYLIIITIVFLFYTVDYYLNDKYDIEYTIYKIFSDNLQNNNFKGVDPHFNFSVNLFKINDDLDKIELDNNFILLDSSLETIERNKFYSKNPKDLAITVLYTCLFNCSQEREQDKGISYILNFTYRGYKIDHDNEKIPLETTNENYIFYKEFYFSLNKSTFFEVDWEIIKYREEKGLLGLFDNWFNKKNEYIAFDLCGMNKLTTEKVIAYDNFDGIPSKFLSAISFGEQNNQFVEYIRTKKSPLDVLADIGSLFATLLNIFIYIFCFYSRNVNNYQIIQKLLSNSNRLRELNIKICKSKTIKFKNNINRNKNYENFDKLSIDTSKSVPFKSNDNNNNITNKIEDKNDEKDGNFSLKGVYFIHFLFKHFNFKNKKMKNKIEIINICNDIIFKYISIENILYNQIIFENLLKDYKWNEPNLMKIDNNFLIKKLKSIN